MTERELPIMDEERDRDHPDVVKAADIMAVADRETVAAMLAKPQSASRIDPDAGHFCRVTFLSPPPLRVPFPLSVEGLAGITQVAQLFPADPSVTHRDLGGILARTLQDFAKRVPEALALPGFATLSSEQIAKDYAELFPVPINREGRTIWHERLDVALGLRGNP